MAAIGSRVTVGLVAVLVAPRGRKVTVKNTGAVAVSLGGPGVTAATGFDLAPGAQLDLVDCSQDELWGIAGTAGQIVHVLAVR